MHVPIKHLDALHRLNEHWVVSISLIELMFEITPLLLTKVLSSKQESNPQIDGQASDFLIHPERRIGSSFLKVQLGV